MVLVQEAEATPYLPQPELGAIGEREERHVGLREVDGGFGARLALARLDPHHALRVRVDLTEEVQLDLAGEETVLTPWKAPGVRLVDVALGEVAGEVGGDADVEEELTGAAALVQRERLAGAREVGRGDTGRRSPRRRW